MKLHKIHLSPFFPCFSEKKSEIEYWFEAVEQGAQGNYSSAAARLAHIYRDPSQAPALRSLAYSTYASHLRQQGRHDCAFSYDNYALQQATIFSSSVKAKNPAIPRDNIFDPDRNANGLLDHIALLDALIGLAADSLGMTRYLAAQKYLARAEALLFPQSETRSETQSRKRETETIGTIVFDNYMLSNYVLSPHRMRLRWLWVKTELMLYTDDLRQQEWAQRSIEHLNTGLNIPARYRLKTWLITQAAQTDIADFNLTEVMRELTEHKLLPLQWAFYLMRDCPEDAAQVHSQFQCENWLDTL